jgi:hypothetical protein
MDKNDIIEMMQKTSNVLSGNFRRCIEENPQLFSEMIIYGLRK